MSGWTFAKLHELGSVERGRSRHRPRNDPALYGGPYPFVQTGDIKAAGLRLWSYEQTYSEVGLAQSRLWPAGTLCITIAANIGDTAILGVPACFPDSIVGFIPRPGVSDTTFVKYLLDATKQRLTSISHGATQDNLSLEKLLSQDLYVPPLIKQQRIAEILEAYDDLIEVNRRRVALLEEMARGLFEEWFVRFRFPGRDKQDVDGELPEGWSSRPFSSLADFNNGYAFKPADFEQEGLPIVKIPELKGGTSTKTPRNSGSKVPERLHIDTGDLLFSWSGTLAVSEWTGGPALLNQHLFRVLSKGEWHRGFLKESLRAALAKFDSLGVGATMKHIRRSALDTTMVAVPPAGPLQDRANRVFASIYDQIIVIRQQAQVLTSARDLLLPRLISGQLSVAEAELELAQAA